MSERVKQVAREEVQAVQNQAHDAVASGTYLYPLKGIYHFMSHRSLWKPLLAKLTPTLSLGIGSTVFCFVFLYLPQAAVLAIFNGPLAVLTTILLTLSEASTLTTVLSRTLFLDDALVDTFDGTLMTRNMASIVQAGREVKPRGSDPVGRLGKLLTKPFRNFTPRALIRYFLYLPLNFIPVIGTVLFVVLQGRKLGPTHHARYFQLKGWSAGQRERWIEANGPAYSAFGVPAVVLESIPFVGILFSFTNTVGAALWAADLETEASTAQELKGMAEDAQKNLNQLAEVAEMSGRDDLRKKKK